MPAPLYLAGPTGTGKSAVAVALARRCEAEIVNADAYQIYQGLDILTAKPAAAEQALVPHHLFSILPLSQPCNAARFADLAGPCIETIARRGKVPLVVGGTGLYIKALTHGLSPLPAARPKLRDQLSALPPEDLVTWFRILDPAGAAATNLANPRYVQRALEITLQSGRPMSAVKTDWDHRTPPQDVRGIFLTRERDDLYDRINRRVLAMVEQGLLDEVRALDSVPLSPTSEKAIGIAEVRAHLAGEITLDECIAAIQQATRRFAKRQITWFKREKEFQTVCLAPDEDAKSAASRILEIANRHT